jgi:hypothetical protein
MVDGFRYFRDNHLGKIEQCIVCECVFVYVCVSVCESLRVFVCVRDMMLLINLNFEPIFSLA